MLFSPIRIGQITLASRLFKTATSETRASEDGFVTSELIDFYEPIAAGGTPLLITGNLYTSLDGKSTPRQLGVDHDDKIPGLKRLVDAVHAQHAKIFAQINHCGRQVVPRFAGTSEAVGPSKVKDLLTGTRPRPLSREDIARIVTQFGDAAERCEQAGFDGIQIHAAHGYLLNQFITPYTNRRSDEFGGALEQRVRVLREVFRAVRARISPHLPVILKLNGSDYLPLRRGLKTAELVEIAAILERDGVDAVEISVGHYESGFPMVRGSFNRCLRLLAQGAIQHASVPRRLAFRAFRPLLAVGCNLIWKGREGYNLDYARQFKARLRIPVICVGGFRTRVAMEKAITDRACDAIAVGRGFIADPFLYHHIRDNVRGPRCNDCNACVGVIGVQPIDCYHPQIRAEKDAMLAAWRKWREQAFDPPPTSDTRLRPSPLRADDDRSD